ncbi:ribosome maturation factor RimP [Helicobacter cappadocius]|uniref:Ribosome maturation factor RimP n=1 Tax=Helicobacter cappadocius TaxID=3063998 RepID=A0AA90PSC9_9HELI|nr:MULTISPECIES: ribosome maturation factor RimP [unclassified Helicobacter]MDO7253308.1 ribosome maturation factor RimP [Helicobacter sp. faydin-H75]MDP2539262.1 ribosome maturation factor RimP [Helicobacter sp. faydin-H76]
MLSKEVEDKIEAIIESVQCYLYDIAFLKENDMDILRISILAKDKNTTLDKCQEVSELISPLLDVYDPSSGKYTFEVSSPGIERTLRNPRNFRLSVGEEVQVRTQSKDEFTAVIKSADEEGVSFEINNKESYYPYSNLKKVKTIFRW